MKIYNSMTNKKEEFIPLNENKVTIYACGPTVYNYFHLGNARPFIVFDVLRRYFVYRGYDVTFVQNFTDVDDKIINAANKENIPASELSERYIKEYYKDAEGLGIMKADVHPKVSEHMPEIIELIQSLIDQGYAYNIDGNVYFKVKQCDEYGKLSKQSLEDLISGARVDVSDEKEDAIDFALWKKKKEGEPYWESPFGDGRPGWHIECSAMSKKYLGETIDIHGGGQDLIFPHHENEIAQSECCSHKTFVRYWMHNGYINVDGEKMSKSLGNFFTIRDISKEFDLEIVRMFILSAHYRSPINFSDESLRQIKSGLDRLYNIKNNMLFLMENAKEVEIKQDEAEWVETLQKHIEAFNSSMDDDLNTANAISAIFEMGRDINSHLNEDSTKEAIERAYNKFMTPLNVIGLLQKEKQKEVLDEDIQKLIDERQLARKNKDFKRADEIRDILKDMKITLEDTREGVKWKRD